MKTWPRNLAPSNADASSSTVSLQSDRKRRSQNALPLNPYADLELPDGRCFRITEMRVYDACERSGLQNHCTEERCTQGTAPRWQVEVEVQGDGRGDNFVFWVRITWGAVRRGELERVGYGKRCDRSTAIILLARERIWQHLLDHLYPPRFSSHQWGIRLEVR